MPSAHESAPSRPTLQTLADRLGVSKTTVAYALKNHPRYSKALRQQVRALADELGYRPNPMVSALMASRMRSPARDGSARLVFYHGHSDAAIRRSPFGCRVLESVLAQAVHRGYDVDVISAADRLIEPDRLPRVLATRGIFGIVLAYFNEHTAKLEVDLNNFSCAAVQFPLALPRLHHAENDHYEIMRLALSRLADLGYERIGVTMPFIYRTHMRNLYRGALAVFQDELPLENRVPMLEVRFEGALAYPSFPQAFRQNGLDWIKRNKIDVVLSLDHTMPENLRQLGFRIPEDIACASLDVLPSQVGTVAGVFQDYETVSAAAVDLVHEQLLNNERGLPMNPKMVLANGQWLEGLTAPGKGEALLSNLSRKTSASAGISQQESMQTSIATPVPALQIE